MSETGSYTSDADDTIRRTTSAEAIVRLCMHFLLIQCMFLHVHTDVSCGLTQNQYM